MTSAQPDHGSGFDEWSIVELFGHRKLAGRVSEQQIGGASFVRLDVPRGDGFATSIYNPSAIYALHPCEESVARAFAASAGHEPVSRWELPALTESSTTDESEFPL